MDTARMSVMSLGAMDRKKAPPRLGKDSPATDNMDWDDDMSGGLSSRQPSSNSQDATSVHEMQLTHIDEASGYQLKLNPPTYDSVANMSMQVNQRTTPYDNLEGMQRNEKRKSQLSLTGTQV